VPYVAQRAMTIAGTAYGPGDAVPGHLIGRRQLTAAINLGRIVYAPAGTETQYVARRPLLLNGVPVEPGQVVPTASLTAHQIATAVATKRLVPQSVPAPVVAPPAAPKRRGRPPRRVQTAPAVGSY
jgi:hypothetical protein